VRPTYKTVATQKNLADLSTPWAGPPPPAAAHSAFCGLPLLLLLNGICLLFLHGAIRLKAGLGWAQAHWALPKGCSRGAREAEWGGPDGRLILWF
jgi:hypothetical protein